jgi:hypothetical protein
MRVLTGIEKHDLTNSGHADGVHIC